MVGKVGGDFASPPQHADASRIPVPKSGNALPDARSSRKSNVRSRVLRYKQQRWPSLAIAHARITNSPHAATTIGFSNFTHTPCRDVEGVAFFNAATSFTRCALTSRADGSP